MKNKIYFIFIVVLTVFLYKCNTPKNNVEVIFYKDSLRIDYSEDMIGIHVTQGKSFNHPTFVIWKEDMNEKFLQTVFITKSYATGIFGHGSLTDSTWDNKPGESIQPAALPYWSYKKGLIDNVQIVPTKEHPYVDAYTGATPKGDFELETRLKNYQKPFRLLLEVNQTWDWNNYWTNNKYPSNTNYKHSAQPSLIYCVTITETGTEFWMNPIGHGDPTGESGNLFTDISTLTTAKDIFKSIKVMLK